MKSFYAFIVRFLGGKPNGTDHTWCIDASVIRNLCWIAAGLVAISIYTSSMLMAPYRIAELQDSVHVITKINSGQDEQLRDINQKLRETNLTVDYTRKTMDSIEKKLDLLLERSIMRG